MLLSLSPCPQDGIIAQIGFLVVMFRSSVLDRGPPGPRVFWEDRDRTKTDPQRLKDRRSFSVLKFADFLLIFGLFARDWVGHFYTMDIFINDFCIHCSTIPDHKVD